MFWQDFIVGLEFTAVMGVISHVIGELLPRSSFKYDKFPFRSFEWEKGGRVYNKIHVSHWMAKLPDASKMRIHPKMFKKELGNELTYEHLLRYVEETCVAEVIHIMLMLSSVILPMLVDGVTGRVFMLIYALCNLPFVIIQRYNRPMLVRILKRMKKREGSEKTNKEINCESIDTVM